MSEQLTLAFLIHPWLAGLTWLVLHGADWFLTIAGARARQTYLARVAAQARSDYELNPIFRADVAKLGWWSKRFLATWFGIALLLWGSFAVFAHLTFSLDADFVATAVSFLLGMLLFTRLAVVARHLRNIALFRRWARDKQPVAQLDLASNLWVSAAMFFELAVLLGVAAALAGNAWLAGGGTGLLGLAARHLMQSGLEGRRARAKATAAVPPT